VFTLLLILYVIVCIFLILVVLLQQGKGSDVAAAFGGGMAQQSFGPRGTTTLMHKLTTASFIVFVTLCIGLSVVTARGNKSVTAGLKSAPPPAAPAQTEAVPAAAPEGATPSAAATTEQPVAPATPLPEEPRP